MVKLSSGREIELKPLTWRQRAEIKDMALKNTIEKIPVSLLTCGIAVQYGFKISDAELETWQDEEIYEAGYEVFKSLNLRDSDKKK